MNNTVGGFSADGKALFANCLAFFLVLSSHVFGCGLSWDIPQDHFPGVNGKGFVSYFEKVSELDLGDDFKMPLIINFNSGNEKISPYLGKSFTLYLLESNIVQTDDNSFIATFPDGSLNLFIRDRPDDTILRGSAGWRAEINGDTITAWAPCGWKLEYYKGHILSITSPKNRKLEFVYDSNVVTQIRERGMAKFAVEKGNTGDVRALLFNGKKIEITLDQKPRVESVAGQNVIKSIDQSLKSLNTAGGTSKMFEFAVNEKIQPTLKITSTEKRERLFTWDPLTKQALSDGDWSYEIVSKGEAALYTEITRHNSKNQKESWVKNSVSGEEVTLATNGVKVVKTSFVAGPLSGKVRKIEQLADGKKAIIHQFAYDENGQLVREIENGKTTGYYYDQNGRLSYVMENGRKKSSKVYDSEGRVLRELDVDGRSVDHIYSDSPGFDTASIVKRLEHVASDVNEVRTENTADSQVSKSYYSKEGTVLATENKGGQIFEYLNNGREREVFLNGKMRNKAVYEEGHKIREVLYAENGDWTELSTYVYSDSGRLFSQAMYSPDGSIKYFDYTYDALGQISQHIVETAGNHTSAISIKPADNRP